MVKTWILVIKLDFNYIKTLLIVINKLGGKNGNLTFFS